MRHTIGIIAAFAICMSITGCGDRTDLPAFKIDVTGECEPATWVITSGDQVNVVRLPEGDIILQLPREETLSIWSDGYLMKKDNSVEWLDLDRDTGEYISSPDLELTSWDTPVAVDPVEKIVYAFGHSTPPTRIIEAHYLLSGLTEQTGTFVATEIETLDVLPCNGWPIFYIDRPVQAGSISTDNEPTRKLRVYGGRHVGGEFPDVLDFFFLKDNMILNRESEGWILFEISGLSVRQRTMSLNLIPGRPRPLARVMDTILIASDEISEGTDKTTGSSLYSYGAYTRDIAEVWNPADMGSAAEILSLTVLDEDDYYIALGSLPEPDELVLVHYHGGDWDETARVKLSEPAIDTSIYLLVEPETDMPSDVDTSEPFDLSAGNSEDGLI